MRVGIIQSCYAPWRGYFDFIASVDLFVFFDEAQYSKGNWRNRHKIKTESGVRWLTVPVHAKLGMRIDEVRIAHHARPWQHEHSENLRRALGKARFFDHAQSLWAEAVSYRDSHLSALNERLTRSICRYLGISTTFVKSSDFRSSGTATERLVQMLTSIGATTYLSGPSARAYLDEGQFGKAGIELEYKTYSYMPYPQQWGDFVDGLTVLDLIANCGPDAMRYLKSVQPNQVVVG